ncbi:MAG: helix-turn-helix transcriptional regulator [Olsenella sp.]|nr:helix-turn-helix transcriptional regulator [Olsenella sp.]
MSPAAARAVRPYDALASAFADRLGVAMGRCGLRSCRDLADAVGMGRSSASRYISGARLPGTRTLVDMAGALGVGLDWLLGLDGEDEMDLHATIPPLRGPYTEEPQLLLFRRRLRDAMRLEGIEGPSDLSARSGVAHTTVMSYLRGERLPGAVSLVRLSRALGVSCDWLLGFDGRRC